MKYFLSFAVGVLLGASVLIWGPQQTQSAGDDAVAVAQSAGDVQCPYLQGKAMPSTGNAQAECPYLSGRAGQSATSGLSGCPYLSGQTDRPAGAGETECPYLQGGKGKAGSGCPFRDGKAGKSRSPRTDDGRDVRI